MDRKNLVLGIEDGVLTLHGRGATPVARFEPSAAGGADLREFLDRENIENVVCSSAIDFPEEDGVSIEDLDAFMAALNAN